jgi:hypothetical protein
MPEWAVPILEQAPWGAVIVILASMNIRYQTTRDKLFADAMRDVACGLDKVEGAIATNTGVLGEVKGVISRINGRT